MVKCPYCQNEMKKGFVEGDGRAALIWRDEDRKKELSEKIMGFFVTHTGEHILLSEAGIFRNTSVESYYCDACGKVIIDVSTDNRNGIYNVNQKANS